MELSLTTELISLELSSMKLSLKVLSWIKLGPTELITEELNLIKLNSISAVQRNLDQLCSE